MTQLKLQLLQLLQKVILHFEMLSDDDYIFTPENPCEAIYLSNGTRSMQSQYLLYLMHIG